MSYLNSYLIQLFKIHCNNHFLNYLPKAHRYPFEYIYISFTLLLPNNIDYVITLDSFLEEKSYWKYKLSNFHPSKKISQYWQLAFSCLKHQVLPSALRVSLKKMSHSLKLKVQNLAKNNLNVGLVGVQIFLWKTHVRT